MSIETGRINNILANPGRAFRAKIQCPGGRNVQATFENGYSTTGSFNPCRNCTKSQQTVVVVRKIPRGLRGTHVDLKVRTECE